MEDTEPPELSVSDALHLAKGLAREMRESKELCNYVLERLESLASALKTPANAVADDSHKLLADALDLFVRFLKRFSDKKLLQRIAASSAIRREVRELHEQINVVFTAAGLTNVQEMIEWEQHEARGTADQRDELKKVARKRNNLTSDVSGATLDEALTEIQFEIDYYKDDEDITAFLQEVLQSVVELKQIAAPPRAPVWFIRRDAVEIGRILDYGCFGSVHEGIWKRRKVCVKLLYMDGAETQRDFLKETAAWHDLSHENIVQMHGGCHVGEELFFVSEYATKGNFTDFFEIEENKDSLWTLFHQAANGLEYLHNKRKVHCDIKANNILVSEDGVAKLCDFGFTHTRSLSVGMSTKEQPSSAIWKAPECLLGQGPDANPTFMSDVYSLGMSIIEVKIGGIPWGMQSDDDIVDQLEDGYPRPDNLFTDSEWELVQGMTAFEVTERWTLEKAIWKMAELARDEASGDKLLSKEPVADRQHAQAVARSEPRRHVESYEAQVPRDFESLLTRLEGLLTKVHSNDTRRSWLFEYGEVVLYSQKLQRAQVTLKGEDWVLRCSRRWKALQALVIGEIEHQLVLMCLQTRENGPILKILVAGLARVLTAIATDSAQLNDGNVARANEFYEGLLSMLESSSSPAHIFYRIASSRHVLRELNLLRQQVLGIDRLLTTVDTTEVANWDSGWSKGLLMRDAQLANQLADTRVLVEILPDRTSQIEALIILKYELKVAPGRDLVLTAYDKVMSWFAIDVGDVPDWFIPRYEVQYDASVLVGEGAFGSVYQGIWTIRTSGKRVAVKVLRIHGLGGAVAQGSFVDDVASWYRLQAPQYHRAGLQEPQGHEHVLKLYGASHVGRQAFLVLEHAERGNILDILGEEMNISKLCKLMQQAAQGLQYLHGEGIVHGHLRCDNLLISGDETVKVTDFGFDGIRNFINALGYITTPDTLQWTAPELIFDDSETPSRASDVYSLAMCILEALNRGPPWGNCDDSQLLEKLECGELPVRPVNAPDDIWDLVVSMCSSKPSHRPTVEDIALQLDGFASNKPIIQRMMYADEMFDGSRRGHTKPRILWLTPEESVAFIWLDTVPHDPQTFSEFVRALKTWVEMRDLVASRELVDPLTTRMRGLSSVLEKLQQQTEEYQDADLSKLAARDLRELMRGLLMVAFRLDEYLKRFGQEQSLCQFIRNEKLVDCLQQAHEGVNAFVLAVRRSHLKDEFYQTAGNLGIVVSALNYSEVFWRDQVTAAAQALQGVIEDCVRRVYENSTDPKVRRKIELTLEYETQRSRRRGMTNPFVSSVRNAMRAPVDELLAPLWFLPSDVVTLGDRIGNGGYGEVWQGTLDMTVHVAIKRVLTEEKIITMVRRLYPDERDAARIVEAANGVKERGVVALEREVRVWQHLNHPHILHFYGATAPGPDLSVVSELAPFGKLYGYWAGDDASVASIRKAQMWQLLLQAALGLQHMHESGFIHGDLKCDNIFVGDDSKAKLADFGLSFKIGDHKNVPCTEAASWLAPECLDKEPKRARTAATDVFMFGMCIVEALTGSPPWGNMTKAQIRFQFFKKSAFPYIIAHFAPAVQELVYDMCRLEPDERISMVEVVERLKALDDATDPQLLEVSAKPI